jgi:integrase/recombinase XerD
MQELDEYFATLEVDKSPATIASYRGSLNNFIEYFKIKNASDIEKLENRDIQNYLNYLATKNITETSTQSDKNKFNASANTHGRNIKVFLNWLVAKKYMKLHPYSNDIKKFAVGSSVKIFFNKEERDKIILACDGKLWLQVTMALLFYTGMRRAEIVNLKKSDFMGDHILVHRKGNKEQELYFPRFVGTLIRRYLAKRKDKSEYLLVGIRTHDQISEISLANRVKEAVRLAGFSEDIIEQVGAHSIRRSFACILFLDGASTLAVQNCLGHSSSLITERYVAPARAIMTGKVMSSQADPSWYIDEDVEDE